MGSPGELGFICSTANPTTSSQPAYLGSDLQALVDQSPADLSLSSLVAV